MATSTERPQSPSATPAPISFSLSSGTNGVAPLHRPGSSQGQRPVARSVPTSPAINSMSSSGSHHPSMYLGREEPPVPDFGVFASRSGPQSGVLQDVSASKSRPAVVAAPSPQQPVHQQSVQVSRSVPASPTHSSTKTIPGMPLGANWGAVPPSLDLHSSGSSRSQFAADVPVRSAVPSQPDPRLQYPDPRMQQADPRMQQSDPRLQQSDPRLQHPDPRRSQSQGPSSAPISLVGGNWHGYGSVSGSNAGSVIGDRDDVGSVDDMSVFGAESQVSSATLQFTKDLSEGRIKMLREDNQMLRENLRREQQAREDIAKLMREECAALAKRVKDEYEQRAAAQSELDALRLDADAAKLKLREVAEEVERKEKLAQHLRERVEVLEGKVEHKSDELDQAKGRMQSLEDSVREETARGDQERARADRTWEDLTQAREKARNLAAQLNDEQEEVKNGRMEIDRLKSDLHLSEVRHADALEELRRDMEAKHSERLNEVLEENSFKMEEQLSRNAKIHDEFSSMMADQREVQGSADTMRGKLVAVSEELHHVNEENRDLKDRVSQLEKSLSMAQGPSHHLRNEHDSMHDAVSSLQQSNVALMHQRSELQTRLSASDIPNFASGPPASPRHRGLPPSGPPGANAQLLMDSVRALQPNAQIAARPVRVIPQEALAPPEPVMRHAPPQAAQTVRAAPPPPHPGTQQSPQGSLPHSYHGTPSDSGHVTPHGSSSYPAPPHNNWYNPPEPQQPPPQHQQPPYAPPPRMPPQGQRAPSPMRHPPSAMSQGPQQGSVGPGPGPGMHGGGLLAQYPRPPPPHRYDPHHPQWQPAPMGPPPHQPQGYSGAALHEMTPEQIYMAGYDPNTVIGV